MVTYLTHGDSNDGRGGWGDGHRGLGVSGARHLHVREGRVQRFAESFINLVGAFHILKLAIQLYI